MYELIKDWLQEVTEEEILDARLASQMDMLEDGMSGEEIRVGE